MNAIELKAIVNDLIEDYCDNVNPDFRYTIKEKDVDVSCIAAEISIWYTKRIDSAGCPVQTFEWFFFLGNEKPTMLQDCVFECLDRIYKAELIDNRKSDDPSVG